MRKFYLGFICSAFIAGSAPAWATEQTMTYEVYAGGIHAVQAQLTLKEDAAQGVYNIVLSAKTRGFLGRLAPWHGTFESHGKIVDNVFKPLLHRSTTTWKDEEEVKSYQYKPDGRFDKLVIKDHDKPERIEKPDLALIDQTTDALTATLSALKHMSNGQSCDYSADVFDGKRRYAQTFTAQKNDVMTESRYNAYVGDAQICNVEIEPKGGAWHKKPRGWMSIQEQGRKQGTMPSVWMARMQTGLPAIPVKIRVKTDYGTLFMHMSEYYYDDDILLAEKRTDRSED